MSKAGTSFCYQGLDLHFIWGAAPTSILQGQKLPFLIKVLSFDVLVIISGPRCLLQGLQINHKPRKSSSNRSPPYYCLFGARI